MNEPVAPMFQERSRLPAGRRRALILAAAAHGFGADGYDATTIEWIAGEAGVTKPMVYRHFESKKALYLELLAKHAQDLPSFFEGIDPISSKHREAELRIVLDRWFGYVAQNSHAWEMLFRDRGGDEEIQAFRSEVSGRAREVIASVIATQPSGLADAEVMPTAEFLRSGLAGLALQSIDDPQIPRATLVEVALRMSAPAFDLIEVK